MKRIMLILSIFVIGALILAPGMQVSADPGGNGGGNGGGHGNQGGGGNHGNNGGGGQGQHGNNSNGQGYHNSNNGNGQGQNDGDHGQPPDLEGTPPAPGAGSGDQHGHPLHYKGLIATVDAAGMTLTLEDGSSLAFAFDAATIFKIPTLAGTGTAADLLQGMKVTVKAVDTVGVLTATKVVVVPGRPMRVHRVGVVTAYTPTVSITILARDGQEYTFALAADVRILPPELADTLAVGAKVTIIAPRDVTQLESVAVAIVIHTLDDDPDVDPTVEPTIEPTVEPTVEPTP